MTTWGWQGKVSEGLLHDKVALQAHLDQLEAEARLAAAVEGWALGRPTTMKVYPQVWVEGWSKDGGAYVSPAIARMANVVGEKAGALVAFEWPAERLDVVVDGAEGPAGVGPDL